MVTVLFLGGYGQFGLPTAQLVAADPHVDRVIIAGRSLPKAQAAAAQIGPNAEARQIDADDPSSLASGLAGVDLVVSTLWSTGGRAEHVPRAAIAAGAHYIDLNGDANDAEVDRTAREQGLAILTGVGMSPGVLGLLSQHLTRAIEEPSVVVAVRHWTRLLDAWADLFDAYIDVPGGRTRGPQGRRLAAALTETPRDPGRVATVLEDACVVPFWVTLAGDPERWTTLPTLVDGAWIDVDVTIQGLEIALTSGAFASERLLVATGGPEEEGSLRRFSATTTGMRPAFDEGVRHAARRIAAGADADAEVRALEARVVADVEAFLRSPDEVAALPTGQFLVYGSHEGRPARASLVLNDALFAAERFLGITAAAIAVTVRYLLNGTITTQGTADMTGAIENLDAFASDYMALVPGVPEGTPLYAMRVDLA